MNRESDKFVCVKDYQATAEDEISVRDKERFHVLSMEKDRWLVSKVQLYREEDPVEGYVPYGYLVKERPLQHQKWFININRIEAETLLLSEPNIDGSFLVRPSEDSQYCLSVRKNDEVVHHTIRSEDTGVFFIDNERTFSCIHDLVLYYRHNKACPFIPFINGNPVQPKKNEGLLPENCAHVIKLGTPRKLEVEMDPWGRPSSDFTLVRELKNSSFRFPLWEGKWMEGRRQVLIQTIPKGDFEERKFQKGLDILKTLNHRNVIELYALCSTEDPVYVVSEFMKRGDLQSLLRGAEGPLLTMSQLMHMADQVADGMAYLEVKRVVHCQLTGFNILVGNQLHCKISGFELAVLTQNEQSETRGSFPVKWLPPEFIGSGMISEKTDVWSFGIVLYELFTLGQVPYKGVSYKDVYEKLQTGYRLPMPPLCTADMYSFVTKCWYEDPVKRPSFQEIVEQRIFKSISSTSIS